MAETKERTKMTTAEMPKIHDPKTQDAKMVEMPKSLLKTTEVKQKVKVIDLDKPEDDSVQVEIVYTKYDFDKAVDHKLLSAELDKLVTPLSERNKALAAYAQSASYQTGKEKAFSAGNYLTPELRTAIVDYLRMTGKFNENTSKEIFTRWLDGYKGADAGKKSSAKKILDRVSEAQDAAGDL